MDLLGKIKRTFSRLHCIHMDTGKSYLGICKHFFYLYVTRGFGFVEYHDFELDKVSKEFVDSFLNWKEQQYFLNLLNPRKYYSLARNKYLTHIILDALEINNKATLYCYYNPELRKYHDSKVSFDVMSTLSILKAKNICSCVIKTTESSHGENVWVIKNIEYENHDIVFTRFDGRQMLLSELLGREPLIFESLIKQTKQLSDFNPSSVNTIRFMTTLFPDGEARVIATFIKIGRSGKCVDNAGGGGNVDACVDIETGKLCYTIQYKGWRNVIDIQKHPDTGVQIEDVVINDWEVIKEKVIKFQKAFPFVKAAGWDIAITDNGPVIVEVNDMWDRTGQLFIRRGWKPEIEECYNAWKKYYN
ncbi:MAG: hypothetical protein KH112_15505 [Sanguibacteroides justesenii]|jgi:putative hexapeptide transferase family protein|nr:hypothetical protein [Sanguibacteroides justesenii]